MRMHSCWIMAAALAGTMALGGCEPDPSETQINARIKSPDGRLEAVYADNLSGGAAVGATEEVFVVLRGRSPRLHDRVFSKECVHNLQMAWDKVGALHIGYDLSPDIRENPELSKPSILSVLSSAYWTYPHPHGVSVYFSRGSNSDGC